MRFQFDVFKAIMSSNNAEKFRQSAIRYNGHQDMHKISTFSSGQTLNT